MSLKHRLTHYRGKLICLTIFLVALAPLLFAIVAYRLDWISGAKTNHGQLITPVLQARQRDHHWVVWFVYPRDCDKTCLRVVDKLVRCHMILGKDKSRTQLALSVLSQQMQTFSYPIDNWKIPSAEYQQQFGQHPSFQLGDQGDIYLVDPHGNVFMHYDTEVSLVSLHKDITRVLKASRIG